MSKYSDKHKKKIVRKVLDFLEIGVTLKIACRQVPIDPSTLWVWRKEDKTGRLDDRILKATQEGRLRLLADRAPEAEDALLLTALGFKEVTEEFEPKVGKDGKRIINKATKQPEMILVKRKTKTKGPDKTALFFLLINMSRHGMTTIKWKNVYDIMVGGELKGDLSGYFQQMLANKTEKRDQKEEVDGSDDIQRKAPAASRTTRKTRKRAVRPETD